MSRISRFSAVAALIVVLLIGVPLVVLAVAPMAYSGVVERYLRSATGFDLTVDDLDVTLAPLEIEAAGLVLKNPDPAVAAPLLAADRLRFQIHLGRYFDAAPNWWRGRGRGLDVRFARDARGRTNWDVVDSEETGEPVRENPLLQFDAAAIEDMTVLLILEDEQHRFDVQHAEFAKDPRERLLLDARGRYQDEPFQAAGALVLPHPERAVPVAFRASGLGGEVSMDGVLGHEAGAAGKVRFRIAVDNLAPLSAIIGKDLAGLAPVRLEGRIAAPDPGRWQVEAAGQLDGEPLDLAAVLTTRDPLHVLEDLSLRYGATALDAEGELDWQAQRLRGAVNASRLHLVELVTLLEHLVLDEPLDDDGEPPALHEVVSGLPLNLMENWAVQFRIGAEHLEYQAIEVRGLELDLARREQSILFGVGLEQLRVDAAGGEGRTDAAAAGPWGLVAPLRAEGTLTTADDSGLPGLAMRFATAGIEGELDSRLPQQKDDRLEIRLRGSVTSVEAVQGLGLEVLEDWLPIEADVDAVRRQGVWRADPLELTLAHQQVAGRLEVDRTEEPIRIRGDLRAPEVDLNRVFGIGEDEAAEHGDDGPAQDNGHRLLPDEPIDWSWLQAANVNVSARVDRILLSPGTFRDVRGLVRMRNGELLVDPVDADLLGGSLRGHLRVRRRERGAEVAVQLVATGLTPADLGLEDTEIRGGETDLFVDLRGRGRSARDLGASLNGELAVDIRDAVIENNLIDVLGAGVVAEVIRLINPLVEREPRTHLQCAAAYVVASDGVLYSDDQVVLDTDQVIVRASGVVNLREAMLEIDFESEATEEFDVGIADIADLVRIRGPLTDPEVEADPEGVAEALLQLGAAVATAGVSAVVQGLFDDDDGTPCRRIFAAQAADHDPADVDDG